MHFQPVDDRRKVVAVLSFSKMPETDELSFEKGDVFIVLNEMGDGWLWVKSLRTNEDGQIHEALVDNLVSYFCLCNPSFWDFFSNVFLLVKKIDNLFQNLYFFFNAICCFLHIKAGFHSQLHLWDCHIVMFGFQSDSVEPVQGLPYFHASITKEEAVEKLREGIKYNLWMLSDS